MFLSLHLGLQFSGRLSVPSNNSNWFGYELGQFFFKLFVGLPTFSLRFISLRFISLALFVQKFCRNTPITCFRAIFVWLPKIWLFPSWVPNVVWMRKPIRETKILRWFRSLTLMGFSCRLVKVVWGRCTLSTRRSPLGLLLHVGARLYHWLPSIWEAILMSTPCAEKVLQILIQNRESPLGFPNSSHSRSLGHLFEERHHLWWGLENRHHAGLYWLIPPSGLKDAKGTPLNKWHRREWSSESFSAIPNHVLTWRSAIRIDI